MPDLPTSIIIAGAAAASKDVVVKLLGPTADYLGESIRDLVQKSRENISRILKRAAEKCNEELDKPGQVNPRVLKHICDEGRFVEDALTTEYFAGIMAAARTEDGKDDSALPIVNLIKGLSSDQLRLHFVFYGKIAQHGSEIENADLLWTNTVVEISVDELLQAMKLDGSDGESRLLLAAQGLIDEGLLSAESESVTRNWMSEYPLIIDDEDGRRMALVPTKRGARLLLQALGLKGLSPGLIVVVNLEGSISEEILRDVARIEDFRMCNRPVGHEGLTRTIAQARKDLDGRIDELESRLGDCELELDSLSDRLDDLEGTEADDSD